MKGFKSGESLIHFPCFLGWDKSDKRQEIDKFAGLLRLMRWKWESELAEMTWVLFNTVDGWRKCTLNWAALAIMS